MQAFSTLTYVCFLNMIICMKRTTLILEDSCMKGVKELAHKEKRTISSVVNDLLAEGLQKKKKQVKKAFRLPSYSMGKPKVNIGDRNALEALMDS
jgi:hypothetical protein